MTFDIGDLVLTLMSSLKMHQHGGVDFIKFSLNENSRWKFEAPEKAGLC